MEIPSKVRIGSKDYEVKISDDIILKVNRQCYGHIDCEHHKIEIDNTLQDNQGMFQTFLHELVHGIVHEFKINFSADEEDIVDRFADGLHQVIRDNLEEVKSIKIGDVQINYGEITDKVSEKMNGDLREALGGIV
ncbi:hypothetical protein [Clostridium neonatale]|uniref:hypothetical protein n=1 Tax=Clostridium neonatale TaxID=137838 RepID=UPI00291C0D85|nr:hypothetical protein CNEO4_240051 [Clostridium neonatale]